MSQSWVKYPKQIIDGGLRDFTSMAAFSRPNSSLYQSLIIGILEIIQRFKQSSKFIESLIFSLNEYILKAENYAANSNYSSQYLNTLRHVINSITNVDVITGLYWINYFTEQSSSVGADLDYAVRLIICCIIEDNIEDQMNIIQEKPLNNFDKILQSLSSTLCIKISVFENNTEKIYVKNDPGDYPSLNLLKDKENYSILYSNIMIEVETNQNFDLKLIESPPFVFSNKPNQNFYEKDNYVADSFSIGSDMSAEIPLNIPNELKYPRHLTGPVPLGPCMPGILVEKNLQSLKSKRFFKGPIINPNTGFPGIYKTEYNQHNQRFSENIIPSGSPQIPLDGMAHSKSALSPPKLELKGRSQVSGNAKYQSFQGPINNKDYGKSTEQSLQKKCEICLKIKMNEDFGVISCGNVLCSICNLCRCENTQQCLICKRFYSDYENDLIKVIKVSKIS